MDNRLSVMTERVPLPSRALVYDKELEVPADVLVRPFLTVDQKGLFGTGGAYGLDMLLDNCLNGDYKFRAKDLIAADKAMLLIRLRAISLGAVFVTEHQCPSCGARVQKSWNLDDIQVSYLQTEEYPIKLTLPESKHEVTWRFLTDAMLDEVEEFLTKKADRFEKFNKRDERNLVRDAMHLLTVDGKQVSLENAWQFYGKLPATDSAYLSYITRELDIGPEVRETAKCSAPGCGREFPVVMRTGLDFFRPKFELPAGLGVKRAGLDFHSDTATASGSVRGDELRGDGADATVREKEDVRPAEGPEEG